jgi:hypothetical protein
MVVKPEGKSGRRWEDDITTCLMVRKRGAVDWIYLTQEGARGELLCTRQWTFFFHKRRGISWCAKQLSASQEGLCSVEFVCLLGVWTLHLYPTCTVTTGWTTGRSGFDPRQGQRIFPLASLSRPALGPTQPPVKWVPGVLSPGVKRGRGMMLTTHPHLVPRSWMSRSYTSPPQAPSWRVEGLLYFYPTCTVHVDETRESGITKDFKLCTAHRYAILCDTVYTRQPKR